MERFLGPEEAIDAHWMRRALDQARLGVGGTSPNPPVGAVIAKGREMLAKGFHEKAGGPHAEIAALRALPDPSLAKGATLYVTLEPCSTQGRTPPCVAAIIDAGIGRVVFGSTDPNPAHAGRAVDRLRQAGVEVSSGLLANECDYMIRIFRHWIATGEAYVIAKAAFSLDGRLSPGPGKGQWLTGKAARRDAQNLRREVDAILIGAETLRKDDPSLTVRRPHAPPFKAPLRRVVLTRSGQLPGQSRVFIDAWRADTWVMRDVDFRSLPRQLAERGVTSVLIEGGGQVLGQAFAARIVQEACFYFAPCLCGGAASEAALLNAPSFLGVKLREPAWDIIGPDARVRGMVTYE